MGSRPNLSLLDPMVDGTASTSGQPWVLLSARSLRATLRVRTDRSPRSPWQNPYVERLIGTVRRDCLDQMLIFGEAPLRQILSAYGCVLQRVSARTWRWARMRLGGAVQRHEKAYAADSVTLSVSKVSFNLCTVTSSPGNSPINASAAGPSLSTSLFSRRPWGLPPGSTLELPDGRASLLRRPALLNLLLQQRMHVLDFIFIDRVAHARVDPLLYGTPQIAQGSARLVHA